MDSPSTRTAMSMSARFLGLRGRKSILTRRGQTTSAHCRSSKGSDKNRAISGETTMRAVWYDRQGAAEEVLVRGELPTPDAGYGEVRVKLEASGVNPSDTYRRRGPPAMEYPRVITNSDGAGVIDQVGPGVDQQRLGKRVWLYNGQRNGRWMGNRGGIHCALRRPGHRTTRSCVVRGGRNTRGASDDRAPRRFRRRTGARKDPTY